MNPIGREMPVLCVAGTGPGVGKTTVACGLARRVRAQGGLPAVVKPLEVGCRYDERSDLVGQDGEALRAARGHPMPPLVASPYRFATSENPVLAARRAGLTLRLSDLEASVRTAGEFGDVLIVELPTGAGAPIAEDGSGLDLAKRLASRVLVVASPIPGVEGLVLGLVAQARARGLELGGVVLDAPPPEPASAPSLEALVAEVGKVTVFPGISPLQVGDLPRAVEHHLEEHLVLERSFGLGA